MKPQNTKNRASRFDRAGGIFKKHGGILRTAQAIRAGIHPPELKGYTKESTIAEKFQAMVKLGVLNSRMKDFYDIWFLSRMFDFRGETLAEAIEKTFKNRNTPITVNPTVFDLSFTKDEDKKVQWLGFIKKAKLTDAPGSFEDVAGGRQGFSRAYCSLYCRAKKDSRHLDRTWPLAVTSTLSFILSNEYRGKIRYAH